MQPRRAGVRGLVAGALIVLAAFAASAATGLAWGAAVGIELSVLIGLVAVARLWGPVIGAEGDEPVGRLLEPLAAEGWLAVHGVSTGRGDIDTVLVGPGGLLTVEVEATPDQAYAQKRWLELITGRPVDALLLSPGAHPAPRGRGVLVLPARMLAEHLRRREARLDAAEIRALHARLTYAFANAA